MVKQLLLFVITFISIFILSELFIRTSHLGSVSPNEFYSDIGRGRRENLMYVYFNEGFGIGKFNEYRYIGESNPPVKSNNTIRIALMGDSYVESFQVFERDYFGEIAENYLENKHPVKQFELLNFGRSGFDIANIYAYQKTFVEKFNPDFILYMISNGDLEPKYSDRLRPRTIIEDDGLHISFNFDPLEIELFDRTKFLTQNFCILNMLNNGRRKTKTTPILAILLDKLYFRFNPENKSKIIDSKQIAEFRINPVTAKIIKSLDVNKVIIVNRDTQELPSEFQKLCLENNLEYFDLSEVLKLMKEQGNDPNEWKITNKKGHWNQKGHRVIGKEIAEKISYIMNNKNNTMHSNIFIE